MKHLILFLLLLIAVSVTSTAQNAQLDSLIQAERSYVIEDSVKLELLTSICSACARVNPPKHLDYCTKSLQLAERLGNMKSKFNALKNLSIYYLDKGEFEQALNVISCAYELSKEMNDSLLISKALNSFGALYFNKSDYFQARQYFQQSVKILKSLKPLPRLNGPYANLGETELRLGNYIEAQEYLLLALSDEENNNDKDGMAGSYYVLGNLNKKIKNFTKAREYYLKAIQLYESLGNELLKAMVNSTLGSIYPNLGEPELAFQTLFETLPILDKYKSYRIFHVAVCNIGNLMNMITCDSLFQYVYQKFPFEQYGLTGKNQFEVAISCMRKGLDYDLSHNISQNLSIYYDNISKSYRSLGNYPEARYYMFKSLALADSVKNPFRRKETLAQLSDLYEQMGQYDSAYYYYKEMIAQRDSIDNKEIHDQLARKEAEYEFSIKEKDLLHQKELSDVAAASANTELQRQLLLTRTREQEILLKDRALEIGQKEKEMQHLAYLKKMAELDVVKLEKQDKDKQLSLTKQSFALQNLKLSKRELERNLLIVGVALSLLSIFLIFRNYRNQRKANLRQQELNALVTETNEELNVKNTELASTLDNLRTTQAQLVETEKQKENEVIRRRISQDIHDDISSGLTRIAWLSELAKEKAARGEQQEAGNALEKILASSRETVDRLGEIIWAINPDRDNLEGFFAYLRTYIVKFFEDTPFKVTLDFPEKKPDLKFNPDLKRTLFLVVKEALHNVAKHSKAGQVAVAFHCPDHRYSITITDDGQGFDVAATQLKGNGLKNMQKRMESVGGEIEIESQPEKGTMVSLSGEVYN